jgi:phosphatidate cytidylyltransferase
MNLHMKRWMTGVIVTPILFWIIAFCSEEIFTLLIIFATLLGMHEYNSMVFGAGVSGEKVETMAAALLILLAAAAADMSLLVALMGFSVMAVLMFNMLRPGGQAVEMISVGKVVLGILYIPLLMSHFILIRQTPAGILWIFFILILAFCGDIAGYYVGKGMGANKLFPRISPGKTVEGTIGLVAGSVAGCLVFRQLFFPLLPLGHAAILGLMGSVLGQLGDLCESTLKRASGVKDSGSLLPGHGGILDRLDCLMFITPFVHYYRVYII